MAAFGLGAITLRLAVIREQGQWFTGLRFQLVRLRFSKQLQILL